MPTFSKVNKDDKIFTELALRLVGIDQDGIPFSFGTAFVIRPYLLVTAKHVFEAFIANSQPTDEKGTLTLTFWAVQIEWMSGEHNYNIWQVVKAYVSPHSDICLLHVGAYNDTASNYKLWKSVPVSLIPPDVGDEVIGFGFHATKFEGSVVENGVLKHLELNDNSSKSIGHVKEVYMQQRDDSMLPFPCFEVDCQFEGGMSGGLVINSNSELCGLVCSSMPVNDGHYSHVAMIWPVMAIEIDFSDSDKGITGTHPLSKLVEISDWKPKGWEKVEVKYLEGERYPNVTYRS